jgi:hypothetical protein
MTLTVTGNMSARLCWPLSEPLQEVLVKIYLASPGSNSTNPKYDKQPKLLDQRTIRNKADLLVGTGKTDAEGNYTIPLSKKYNGGPLEYHLEVSKIPGQQADILNTTQFMVGRLQPVWRSSIEQVYSWSYELQYAFWNSIRSKFDAWMLCGHIRDAQDQRTPLTGMKVTVMDHDWIKDDFLGSCATDDNGFFRIDYTSVDFKQTLLTPLINIETPLSPLPGPGVYFRIETEQGDVLYKEDRKMGNTESRRNIPNCYYVQLIVEPEPLSILR